MATVVTLTANTWTDLYAATGIAVGTRILVENVGSADIHLATQASAPSVATNTYNVLQRGNGVRLSNTQGDSGAWAYCHTTGRILVMAGLNDIGFYPGSVQPTTIAFPSGYQDAFGRVRVSSPLTLFDSKQIHSNQPLYWDDQEVSGTGTTSSHNATRASSTMSVSATTAGKRVRQTFQRFNYQPGKSQQILCTGVLAATGGGTGISSAMGYFDDSDGIFVSYVDGVVYLNVRSSVSGTPVDTSVAQSNWNGDKLDGTGLSEFTLNVSAAQIFWLDFEWLGVGSVRCGFVIDSQFILCHTFHHANSVTSVYMATPNLPIRYEIENDGTGAASTLEHICSTVISEGGQEAIGQLHYASTDNSGVSVGTTNYVALVGIRLQTGKIDQRIDLTSTTIFNATKSPFEWQIRLGATVAGTFVYSDHNDSSVQEAFGGATNTVTGGKELAGGIVAGTNAGRSADTPLENALRLGSSIDGTPNEIVVCVKSYSGTGTFDASLGWRELT